MIRRETWVVLIVFALVLGGAWYWQTYKPQIGPSATPTPGVQYVLDVKEPTMQGVKIRSLAGKSVALERNSQGYWSLTEPKAPTDEGQAQTVMNQLAEMPALVTLDPAPSVEDAGLSPAQNTITVTANGGKQMVILIGKITPTQSGYYLLVDKKPMMVVSKSDVDAILKMVDSPPIQATPTPEATLSSTPELSITATLTSTLAVPTATKVP